MKLGAKILIFLFLTFLSTPTLVALIEKSSDVSMFYNLSEEEINSKVIKEIQADIKHNFDFTFLELKIHSNSKIISENLSRHDNVTEEIFSPPPELI